MVNTVKFSQFSAITLNGVNSLVGLSNGNNAISSLPISWTTSGRPVAPTNGFSGYNTSLSEWEFWNATTSMWEPVGGGGAGTVTLVDTGTGLTGGPITSSGTISFAAIGANSLWANTTGGSAVPAVTPLSTFLLSANNLSDLPNKVTARSNLGVAIGVDVEAWSMLLDEIAGGTWPGAASIITLGTVTTGVWHASTITVPFGGTGNTSFTSYSVLCAGTTSTGPFQNVSGVGSSGQVLTSNGAAALPTWQNTGGTGTVNPGLINQVAYYAASGSAVSGLATANNGVLITSGGGVPSISSTLPSAVQGNITTLGTITSGTWNGTTIDVAHGGTGNTTFTAYSLICAGTASTLPFQNVSGLGSSGQVLTSNGAGGLPTWQAATGSGTVNAGTTNELAYYASNGTTVSGLATANNGVLVTDGAGVPSISSTLPVAVQLDITELGTINTGTWQGTLIDLAHGGTNANLTASNGGIFYSTASAGAILLGTATAHQVLLSGSSAAPTWSSATYPVSTSINRILYSSAANTISEIATLANSVLVTDGTGIPSIANTLPALVQGNITTLGTITAGVWHGTTIDVAHGGTGNTTFTAYSVICAGTTSTGVFQNVSGLGASGQVLTSNGAAALPTWQNVSGTGTVNSATANDLAYYATTGNAVSGLASANGGVLVTSNTGVPSILAGSGTTGTIVRAISGGTPAWSTATYPSTTTINQLLYSSATNVIAGLSTDNSGVLVTSSTGVPSILAAGTTGQVLQASTAGTPSWSTVTYPSTAAASGSILISDGTNFIASTSLWPNTVGTNLHLVLSNGTSNVYSTPAYPNASVTAGKVIVSDGTNYVASTPTFPNASATSGKFIVSDGTNWIASTNTPITAVTVQVFTSTGTYTPTTGMSYCTIEVVGGGGGGGGAATTALGSAAVGGAGGGGGYARKTVTAATIGASQAVTIGAAGTAGTAGANAGGTGGTTSVGAIVSATGGVGGTGTASSTLFASPGSLGGAGSSGDFNTNGNPGGAAFNNAALVLGGHGGNSFFGGGAVGKAGATGTGNAAVSYGGGGAGGITANSAAVAGGAGFKGIVVVTEFIAGS